MGLDAVTQEIADEAEAKAERIRQEAKQQREELLDEAREEAERIREQARNDAESEAESLRRKELSAARMDARQERLAAREDVLEDVFDRFRDRVHDMDDDTEEELVAAALDRLDDDIDIGTVHARDALEDVADEYGTFEPHDARGVVVETADGNRRFDLTFDSVADDVIAGARKEVSQVLFE
ncbi:MAG: V-type ATP synthase subunit E family protein [Candidatus Nanohaloarchaea archaeon]|nr:V-type ATP synthase subunit E family protein [Candidatus Nanohaloarchaea archaeon]